MQKEVQSMVKPFSADERAAAMKHCNIGLCTKCIHTSTHPLPYLPFNWQFSSCIWPRCKWKRDTQMNIICTTFSPLTYERKRQSCVYITIREMRRRRRWREENNKNEIKRENRHIHMTNFVPFFCSAHRPRATMYETESIFALIIWNA